MANDRFIADLLHTIEVQLRKKLSEISLDRTEIERLVAQMLGGAAAGGGSAQLLESLSRIKEGASQKDVIHTLLAEMSWNCRGCAIIILAGANSFVWPGPGMGLPYGKRAGSVKVPLRLSGNSTIVRAATTGDVLVTPWPGSPTETELYRSLGVSAPVSIACIPMTINGRVQAVVIADGDAEQIPDPASFAIMVGLAGMIIEQLPFRERIGFSQFPRLRSLPPVGAPKSSRVSEDVPFETAAPPQVAPRPKAAVPSPRPAVVPPAPARPEPPPIAKPVPIEKPLPVKPAAPPPPVVIEEEPEADVEETMPVGGMVDDYARELEMQMGLDADNQSADIEIDVGESGSDEDEINPAAATFEIEVAEPEMPEEIEAKAEEPAAAMEHVDIEFLESPDDVIYSQPVSIDANQDFLSIETPQVKTGVEMPPDVPEPEALPEEETADDMAVHLEPEVEPRPAPAPPISIPQPELRSETAELPGYNLDRFSGEERKAHEKAIRFARLLVSEIKLYNEEPVKLGREFKDLAMRLREDIARSRALFDQRIPAAIRSNTDYFHDELVRQLADGNPQLLG